MPACLGAAMKADAEHRVNQEEKNDELQEQKHVVAQPLKEAVDVQILDALLPQKRTRNLDRLALQLEEVKNDQHDRQHQEQQSDPGRQAEFVTDVEREQPAIDFAIPFEEAQDDENNAGNRTQGERDQ